MVLLELSTGDIPYADLGSKEEIKATILASIPPKLHPHIQEVYPQAWTQLLHDCWHSDPWQRPSCADVVLQLEALDRLSFVQHSQSRQ